ncbi:MAG: ABC transporter substrate-binding protein [Candidatus Dormiibacterota bacterium]
MGGSIDGGPGRWLGHSNWTRRELLSAAGKGALLAASAGGLISILDACGGGSPSSSGGGSKSAGKGPVNGSLAFSWWGAGERNTHTQNVINLFQQKYPKVSVQGVAVGNFTTYWEKLTVEAAAHNLPDVPQMQVRYMQAYDTRNALRALDDLVASGAIDVSGIPKVIVDSGRGPDGKLYMIPTGSATNNWTYNETMVGNAGMKAPPVGSWSDLQKWLLAIKDKLPHGVYASDLLGGSDDAVWWAWVATHGQPVFTKSGKLGFSKKLMVDYWNWWETLRKAGATVPASMVSEESTNNADTYLALGTVAFTESPANQIGAKQAPLTAAGKGTLKLAPFLKTSQGNGQVLVNNGMSIAANTSNLASAAAWINFFTNDAAGAKAYASDNGSVSVTKLLNAQIADPTVLGPGVLEYLQFMKQVIANQPTIIDFPPNYNAVVLALGNNYSNVSFGKASVASAVDAFFSQANAAATS